MSITELLLYKSSSPVPHKAGVTFDGTNVLVDDWINSWDDQLPLLDIGCGNCNNVKKAAEAGAQVCAGEMSHETVQLLTREHHGQPNISFHYIQLPDQISFSDNSFSGILCSEVFHFLTHDEVTTSVQEIFRILKPGGTLVITCGSEELEVLKCINYSRMQHEKRETAPDYLHFIPDIFELFQQTLPIYRYPESAVREALNFYRSMLPHRPL